MLDIEFLALSNAQIAARLGNRNVVYVYRSGYYRRLLKRRVTHVLRAADVLFDEARKADLPFTLHNAPLWFADRTIYSLVDLGTVQVWGQSLDIARRLLRDAPVSANRLFLLVKAGHPLTTDEHWPEFRASAVAIEELEIGLANIDAIISVLLRSHADIYDFSRLKNKTAFVSALKRRFTQSMSGVPDLSNTFLYDALTQIDFATDTFNPRAPALRQAARSGVLARRLRDFLAKPNAESMAAFVAVLDARCHMRGLDRRALVIQLYAASGEIAPRDDLSPRARLTWLVAILAHEASLLTAPFSATLDALARDWSARMARPEPTLGLWGALAETLRDRGLGDADRLAKAREQLRTVLLAMLADVRASAAHRQTGQLLEKMVTGPTRDEQIGALERLVEERIRELQARGFGAREGTLRHWVVRVKAGVEEPTAGLPDLDLPPPLAQISIAPVFRRFEDLPERAVATALLTPDQSRGRPSFLLLYGPEGAGKLAVARVFARAIECERPTPSGSACLTCVACATNGIPFKELCYREFDLRHSRPDRIAEYLAEVSELQPLFGNYIFVVLQNFELCQGHEFETLLNVLEDPPMTMKFIFTATDLHRVRPAIRSRARVVRVGPVPADAMRSWLERLCVAQARRYEPGALDAIAALHGGLSRYAAETLLSFSSEDVVTVAGLRASAELSWQAGALTTWRAMLVRDAATATTAVHAMAGAVPRKVEHLRAMLAALQLWAAGERAPQRMGRYGLGLLAATELDELAARARDRASTGTVSLPNWLNDAARYWLSCDAREWTALNAYVTHFSET